MPGQWGEFLRKYKYIILVLAVGMLLMLLPSGEKTPSAEVEKTWEEFSLEETETKLKKLLEKMNGVGRVDLMLTLKTGTQLQLAEDAEKSLQDGRTESGHQTVVLSRGSGTEDVVVTQQRYPLYQGALVVCEGADSAAVRLAVIDAVSAITGLSSEKISVVRWNS